MAEYPATSFFHETLIDHRPLEGYVRTRYATDLYEVTTRAPEATMRPPRPARDTNLLAYLAISAGRSDRPAPHELMRERFLSSGCVWSATPSGTIDLADVQTGGGL